MVVTLDPKERYCGCGGVGHLEGIMGHRAIRLRFLDLEPEEVFDLAAKGDERCTDFVQLWHRALAAATASSIHMSGVSKFYVTGPLAKYVDRDILHQHLHDFVAMTPLQAYIVEVLPDPGNMALIGAAVNAESAPAVSA
jgi:predicted NBD/HSP70 family sugar kinase